MTTSGLFAQWTGTYSGVTNGDQIEMTLYQNGSEISGSMKDSYQVFDIVGTVNGDQFLGTATETTYLLKFELKASKSGNTLECKLSISIFDNISENVFTVQRDGENSNGTSEQVTSVSTTIPFPADATFPDALIGNWTKNESYNSGYGDNFMGANFSQSMSFNADGTLSEGASSASMSGSNYSNQSSGGGTGIIEGVGWYAKQKNLYFIVLNEGSWTSVHAGTWYAENGNLLLTGTNGEKVLMSR